MGGSSGTAVFTAGGAPRTTSGRSNVGWACAGQGPVPEPAHRQVPRAAARFDDVSVSPVIRQALQHWGYQLASRGADKYVKLKKLPALPRAPRVSTAAASSSAPGAKKTKRKRKKATASKN